jgi:acetoin utilization protein AcuB
MDNARVEDVMTCEVITVNEGTPIAEAVELLQRQEIRHLPVLDADGEVVGMLSDRDLRAIGLSLANDESQLARLRGQLTGRVSELMSSNVVSVAPTDDLRDAVDCMLEAKVGALPVIDRETDDLVGIISYVDLLRLLRTALEDGD